jgi:hypothetical protein
MQSIKSRFKRLFCCPRHVALTRNVSRQLNRSLRAMLICLFDPPVDWQQVLSWALIAIALVSVTGMWPRPAQAAEIGQDQANALYAIAYGHSGIGVPDKPPVIRLVAQEKLAARYCGRPCAIAAGLIDGEVWLDQALDMTHPVNASILLHELVHYVQWAMRGAARSCAEHRERELQAYTVQAYALDRVGIEMPRPSLPVCL